MKIIILYNIFSYYYNDVNCLDCLIFINISYLFFLFYLYFIFDDDLFNVCYSPHYRDYKVLRYHLFIEPN